MNAFMQEYKVMQRQHETRKLSVMLTYNECIVHRCRDPDKYVPTFNCLGLVGVLLNLIVNTIADCPAMSF